MTPKEKAKELVKKFELRFDETDELNYWSEVTLESAKQCALICLKEVFKHTQMIDSEYYGYSNPTEFYIKVKEEINNL